MRHRQSLWQVFAVPAVLAALSIVGLVSALTGDGIHNAVSWIGLAIPVIAVVWAVRYRRE